MVRMRWIVAAVASLGVICAQDAGELFRARIEPVLKKDCHGCHGEGQTLAKLDLRTRESMLKGGERGPAIVPGDAARSLLLQVLEGRGALQMPPGGEEKRLPEGVIAAIRRWIDAGAPTGLQTSVAKWNYKPEDLWAFQPLKTPKDPGKGIDSSLGPTSKPADRRTLIRRATLDLHGLPPTPEEVDAFLTDTRPDAFARLVDRLLTSPRYGERWGRHWLDVVRYADTDGYSNDYERPNAWRYRDYVIRSFNQDTPYDRFIVEQLAGDEMYPSGPENLVATGFLRMGPWEQTGMSVAALTRQQWLDDVTHSTATVFLGLTMGCARCHDHKFDPIPTRDYYALQAVFASTDFAQREAPFLAGESRDGFERDAARVQELIRWCETRIKELPPRAKLLDPGDLERERIYRKRLEIYRRQLDRYRPLAFSVKAGAPADTHILRAGNLRTPAEKVDAAVVSAAWRSNEAARAELPKSGPGRRLALARWIASPANPLTARVMVNRLWQYHFAEGLAANANNFGKMGKKPSNPELLDFLAGKFIESGWSIKAMHRLIMNSAAYQTSALTPRRLSAEELRDSVLAASGELNLAMGGPGVFPEINEDVAQQPVLIMGTLSPVWQPSPERAQRNRRSIYVYQKRGIPDPSMELFNHPGSDASCERRDAGTVPMQAFTLFNGKFARDMALALAARIEKMPGDAIDNIFRAALQRAPAAEEKRLMEAHRKSMTAHHERAALPAKPERKSLVRSLIGEYTGKRFDYQEEGGATSYEDNIHPSEVPARVRALSEIALVLFNSNEFMYVY